MSSISARTSAGVSSPNLFGETLALKGPGMDRTSARVDGAALDVAAFRTDGVSQARAADAGPQEAPTTGIMRTIDWGTKVNVADPIKVYFATAGQEFDGETSLGWNPYEQRQAMLAFQQFANVCNVSFEVTTNANIADFKLVTNNAGSQYLGYFNPPGETNEGVGVFARNGTGWDETSVKGLEQGGFGFITMIHEFGHGMGLAHPHDNGGTSTVMQGVSGPFNDYGDFDLNQGVWTTMSYNDGWATGPNGNPSANSGYGWQGTMMAIDIAVLQFKYGANMEYHDGKNNYKLADANAVGVNMYACIWDGGGKDQISYGGDKDCVIDLTAATIDYSPTGGGVVSYVDGIYGGYTIARNVVIENATGGNGDDRITGNSTVNNLNGRGGADTIDGGLGIDKLTGGAGADTFNFSMIEAKGDTVLDLEDAFDTVDLSDIDAKASKDGDQAFVIVGAFSHKEGQMTVVYQETKDQTRVALDVDGDGTADMTFYLRGDHADFDGWVL